jgi:hypothetical protein
MEIIKDRHGTPSTIIKSQIPVAVWHDVNGEQTAADAMFDSLVCSDHQLECKGESLKKRAHVAHIEPSN